MNDTMKRYILSSVVTFLTAFLTAVTPMLGDVSLTQAALFGLLAVGARAGIKAIIEGFAGRSADR